MRRVIAVVAVAALLAATGCSGAPAGSKASLQDSSAPVVLGTSAATEASGSMPPASSGVTANSIPAGAFAGIPGVGAIAVASGQAAVSRSRAIEVVRALLGASAGRATLVSAVHVTLPVAFMRAARKDSAQAKPTSAWIVTYTNVVQVSSGPASAAGPSIAGRTRLGNTSVAIDARSGKQLVRSDYPVPK